MFINTNPHTGYTVTAVSVPLEINAINDNGDSILILSVNTPGQYQIISPSERIELNQSDAVVAPYEPVSIAPLAASTSNIQDGNNITLDSQGNLVFDLQAIRKMTIADWHEKPLSRRMDRMSDVVSTPYGANLKPTAQYAVMFGWEFCETNVDAWHKYCLILPIAHPGKKYALHQSYLALGYINDHSGYSNPAPKLGQAMCTSLYPPRIAALFPSWACPDQESRLQSFSAKGLDLTSDPWIMGICIIPIDTVAIVMVKPEHFQFNTYNMEYKGLAGFFAVNNQGVLTHLCNQTAYKQSEIPAATYSTNGQCSFVLGKNHSDSNYRYVPGLSAKAKVYWSYDPLDLKEQDFIIKQAYMFDSSRHDITSAPTTVQSTWRVPGSLTPSAQYPSSDWLNVDVEGNVVTINAQENTTGQARQGVANLLADINGVTYTILINQEG